jgi:cyclase
LDLFNPEKTMRISRRQFIFSASGAVAASILPFNNLIAQGTGGTFTLIKDNIGTYENRGGTIGWYAAKDALVVVDAQFPESAESCWKGLQKKTARRIDVLLNTHHHGDHTAGNLFLGKHAEKIVAHENVPKLQRRSAEQRGNLDKQVYAGETFTKSWKASPGNETITATYYGPAHTSGDAIIHFENADIVHMGDLIFNRIPPYIDRPAGASIENWAKILGKVYNKYTNDTVFIFGHGNPEYGIRGNREDLLAMRDFLEGLLAYTQKGIKDGKDKEKIADIEKLPGFEVYYSENRKNGISNCVSVAYDELTNAPI